MLWNRDQDTCILTGRRGKNPKQGTWREIICSSGNFELKFIRGAEVGLLEEPLKKKDEANDMRVSEAEVTPLQYFIIWPVDLLHREFQGN